MLGLLLGCSRWLGRLRRLRCYIRLGLLLWCSPRLGRLRRPRCYVRLGLLLGSTLGYVRVIVGVFSLARPPSAASLLY